MEYRPGDVLLLHTGFTAWYVEQPDAIRKVLPRDLRAPGLAHSEDVCRYLWDTHAAAIASDTFAVEAWPADTSVDAAPFGFIHQMLIGSFGMALGELWWLRDAAADCVDDRCLRGHAGQRPHPRSRRHRFGAECCVFEVSVIWRRRPQTIVWGRRRQFLCRSATAP